MKNKIGSKDLFIKKLNTHSTKVTTVLVRFFMNQSLKYNFANLSLNNCSNCSECKNKEASAFRFKKENSSLQKLLHTKICDIFSNKFSRGEQVK